MIQHSTLIHVGGIKTSGNIKCRQGRGESTHALASVHVN